jgi:RNA chaperone Hfq
MPAQESKSSQPNIQDVFLNYVRREKLTVTIRMMDGSELEGRIKNSIASR